MRDVDCGGAPGPGCEAMSHCDSRLCAENVGSVMRLLAVFTCMMLLCGCGKPLEKSAVPAAGFVAITNAPAEEDIFENITERSGVTIVHQTGTNYFMPDQIGSGVALLDFDQDARLDLYFVQNAASDNPVQNTLYHQQ